MQKENNRIMEPYTFFFGLSGIVTSYLFAAISGEKLSAQEIILQCSK